MDKLHIYLISSTAAFFSVLTSNLPLIKVLNAWLLGVFMPYSYFLDEPLQLPKVA